MKMIAALLALALLTGCAQIRANQMRADYDVSGWRAKCAQGDDQACYTAARIETTINNYEAEQQAIGGAMMFAGGALLKKW